MNHRKAKRNERALIRFLNTRVKWTPAFAQEIQGWSVMKGALSRGEAHAWKQMEREYEFDYERDLRYMAALDEYIDLLQQSQGYR